MKILSNIHDVRDLMQNTGTVTQNNLNELNIDIKFVCKCVYVGFGFFCKRKLINKLTIIINEQLFFLIKFKMYIN